MRATFVFAALVSTACVTAAHDKAIAIQTVAGELRVEDRDPSKHCLIVLGGKTVQRLDCEFSYTPKLLGHFKGDLRTLQEVVV